MRILESAKSVGDESDVHVWAVSDTGNYITWNITSEEAQSVFGLTKEDWLK